MRMSLAQSTFRLRMTCGMIGIGGKAYRRADYQPRWKASDREPGLRASRGLLSLVANRLIVRMPQAEKVTWRTLVFRDHS